MPEAREQIAMSWKFQKWVMFAVAAGVLAATARTEPTDPKPGRDVFERRCTGCHALDSAKTGPPLRRVFSRRSAADPQFPYSDALKKAQITWDAATLDRVVAVEPGRRCP